MQTPDQTQAAAAGSAAPEAKKDEPKKVEDGTGGLSAEKLKELESINAEIAAKDAAAKKKPVETKSPSTPPAAAKPNAGASTEKGSDMSSSKGKKKAKKSKEAKKSTKPAGAAPKKRETVAKEYPSTAKKNPYREGSMKEKAFNIFAKGGERGKMIDAIVKLGATEKTASSWIQFFRKYVATGKK